MTPQEVAELKASMDAIQAKIKQAESEPPPPPPSPKADPLAKPLCEKCAYWFKLEASDGGTCHRYPIGQLKPENDWCGEHSDFKKALQAHDAGETERRLMMATANMSAGGMIRQPTQRT